jgi:hypothetical protein
MIINSIKDMINLVKGQAYYSGLYIKPQETRIGKEPEPSLPATMFGHCRVLLRQTKSY